MVSERVASGRSLFKNKPKFPSKFNLKSGKTYIFPTSFGFVFALFSLILLFIALGYNNNLLYLFVFSTISLALATTYVTNENIKIVKVDGVQLSGEYFAEETSQLQLTLTNSGRNQGFQLNLESQDLHGINETITTIAARSQLQTLARWTPAKRGMISELSLQVSSEFPFSLLRAWKPYKLAVQICVYPKPSGHKEFPASCTAKNHLSAAGLFREIRPYRDFDSIRRVDWRASQRHQSLLIRAFEDPQSVPQFHFSWESTAHLAANFESRLSQLSLWLCQAKALEAHYCLELPSFSSGWGEGPGHFKKCLTALALCEESQFAKNHEALAEAGIETGRPA